MKSLRRGELRVAENEYPPEQMWERKLICTVVALG